MKHPDEQLWLSNPSTRPLEDILDRLMEQLQASEFYVISHDLTQLIPVGGGDRVEIDNSMLRQVTNGEVIETANGYLVPYLDSDNPVLVSRQISSEETLSRPAVGAYFADVQRCYERLEELRRRSSMSIAGQLQWDHLQRRTLHTDHLRAAGILAPAYDVAGDLFDIAIQPDNSVTVTALDAMGHGITAALSAVLSLAAIRSTRQEGATIDEQFRAADQAVADEYGGDRFVTGIAVNIGPDVLEVVNAGHEPMRRYRQFAPQPISVPAQPPLGVEGATEYRRVVLDPLEPGDMLAFLSDGVSGASGIEGELYGGPRVDDLVNSLAGAAPLAISHRLANAVTEYSGGDLRDDVTAVFLQANPL